MLKNYKRNKIKKNFQINKLTKLGIFKKKFFWSVSYLMRREKINTHIYGD